MTATKIGSVFPKKKFSSPELVNDLLIRPESPWVKKKRGCKAENRLPNGIALNANGTNTLRQIFVFLQKPQNACQNIIWFALFIS
jgi:hypothetical protein